MGDEEGHIVAKEIYSELFKGNSEFLDPSAIPYALDTAIKKLQERDSDPSTWAEYIHLGV